MYEMQYLVITGLLGFSIERTGTEIVSDVVFIQWSFNEMRAILLK